MHDEIAVALGKCAKQGWCMFGVVCLVSALTGNSTMHHQEIYFTGHLAAAAAAAAVCHPP
jgi:hypothetical protein